MTPCQKFRLAPGAKEKYRALNKRWYSENPQYVLYRNAKRRAKDIGWAFDLEWRELIIPEMCPLLNTPIVVNQGKLQPTSPSLDRLDSSKGYTKDNVWIISHRANTIKNNSTLEEFELILKNWKLKIGK